MYRLFVKYTMELVNRGRTRYSADAIMHRVRWETNVVTNDESFKINNNHVAFYARMFMKDYPELEGFFPIRKSEADR